MIEFFEKMTELLSGNVPFVCATIVDANGSVPQEIGAKMLVVEDGLYCGTVGGGKVETRTIKEAQALLKNSQEGTTERNNKGHATRSMFASWSLDRDIGMTCGGSVKVYLEAYNSNPWNIAVFGAGHCASALIKLLVELDCRVTCYDPRSQWLERISQSPKVKRVLAENMPSQVASLAPGSFVLLMTMGHTTDKPILLEILKGWKDKPFPYLGVIGSRAKAARLYKDIAEIGLPDDYKSLFYCPIGLQIGTNEPHEIAISIAAQLLQHRDKAGIVTATADSEFGCAEPATC
jgi:xanthine dehydrogenase accessory factor